ncbi:MULTISPECIES: hypothetical protein [Sphingomonas]|uniref:hypothetical protein n=1 Tax=Sphingomonas TaxID=13687 RepID=UPI000B2E9BB6|nr:MULTISPECIES: hypothetical protein [Sphingomonas]MBY0300794.1 hypothetical protein [Sphingomonas ginsenosidimutans]
MNDSHLDLSRETIRAAAIDPSHVAARLSFAKFTANTFKNLGEKLFVCGHILGPDRRDGVSPFGHGDDAVVAVSMLLRIGSELVSGCADLVDRGRHYAGAALVRQLVEVEYLAWAFEKDDEECRRWLRSTREERHSFFTPAKLRKAADGHFRSADYGFHCELGGHPVPGSWRLLNDAEAVGQLMLSDCLGHSTHIWNHFLGWGKHHTVGDKTFADLVFGNDANRTVVEMRNRHDEWKRRDGLTQLPPPPASNVANA